MALPWIVLTYIGGLILASLYATEGTIAVISLATIVLSVIVLLSVHMTTKRYDHETRYDHVS